ncbi:MAG TPA: gamma-glutamyl-gamma-aminobutyrate hydrolase family protein [Anaerolineaceae bacterium]|nr:gamma-glutamyl-gamma-aminobutyrate hydrolase family protein [Anaerolineaceae bacterium]
MPSPLIGLSTGHLPNELTTMIGTTEAYVQAVITAGGIPVLIPVGLPEGRLRELGRTLDGLLLTGGGDIDPARFAGRPHERVYDVDPERDRLEFTLLDAAQEVGMPFFGICRGLQLVNVAFGGSLYTDIADQHPDPLRHDYFGDTPRNHLAHPVQIEEESRLRKILELPALKVNSLHHQGVERVAPGLNATAHAPDGLVEGLELPGYPFGLAVQWHPEWMQEHAPMRAIFTSFIQAAREYHPKADSNDHGCVTAQE